MIDGCCRAAIQLDFLLPLLQVDLAQIMLLHQLDDGPSYDIYILRSFAVSAWQWLSDAAGEYGIAVRGRGQGGDRF